VGGVISFGTDGWRAVIAEDFTFPNVRACAQGVAEYLKEEKLTNETLVIGYDTRFDSEDFAAAAAEVLAANGINVYLCSQAAPTPVISYAITALKSIGGIIITASHNPARWNGFKYKDSAGSSAPSELVAKIEQYANHAVSSGTTKRMPIDEAVEKQIVTMYDPFPVYERQVNSLLDLEVIRQSRLKIIDDSMFGAGIGYFQSLLNGGNIDITEINGERNPLFPGIQPEPIAKNLVKLSNMVRAQKADVGLANDGDADRIGIMDEKGEFLNPHQVFALLTLYFLEIKGLRGPIVKCLTSTNMIYRLGKLFDVPVYDTKVGFKYVASVMIEKDALIGGEESGGYGFRGHVTERDGILAGLYFLDFMIRTGKTPSQLLDYLYSKVGAHYYDREDFHISPEQRQPLLDRMTDATPDVIAGVKVTEIDTTDGFRYVLADDSWLIMRFSGTEPLVRIYAESENPENVQRIIDAGKNLLGF
jgi:alpha-D-glucose phosphate-specific phosphoglucomutase